MTKHSEHVERRVLKHARMFLERDQTIRSVAKRTGWSRSTVEQDLNTRLKNIHNDLYEMVRDKISYHKEIRHMAAGNATKKMWERKRMGGQ